MEKMRLTQKQRGFTLDVIKEVKPGQAYLNHYKVKSMAVADACASRLLKTAKIQAYYQELLAKMEDESIASPKERKQILTEITRGRVSDLLDDSQRIKQGGNLDTAAIQEIDTTDIKIGKGENAALAIITKVKLHNPIQAITELNKMERIYDEGVKIDNRTLNIYVNSDKAKELTEKLIEGERTE